MNPNFIVLYFSLARRLISNFYCHALHSINLFKRHFLYLCFIQHPSFHSSRYFIPLFIILWILRSLSLFPIHIILWPSYASVWLPHNPFSGPSMFHSYLIIRFPYVSFSGYRVSSHPIPWTLGLHSQKLSCLIYDQLILNSPALLHSNKLSFSSLIPYFLYFLQFFIPFNIRCPYFILWRQYFLYLVIYH